MEEIKIIEILKKYTFDIDRSCHSEQAIHEGNFNFIAKDIIELYKQDQALQLLQTDVSKCVYCNNKPYKKGAAYCERHMASDDYS